MNKVLVLLVSIVVSFSGCSTEQSGNTTSNAPSNRVENKGSETKSVANDGSLLNSLPANYASFPQKKGGACSFDKPSAEGDNKFISGWSVISAQDGAVPEDVILVTTVNGGNRYIVASKEKRDDVAKYFKSPKLLNSGFSANIKQSDIPAGTIVTLLQVYEGNLYICEATLKL